MAAEPVEVDKVHALIMNTLANAFGDRPRDVETICRALALASFDIRMLHLKEVGNTGQK